jgi:NADPH:quinone reductase-like Zn-dependent oxidoreductase
LLRKKVHWFESFDDVQRRKVKGLLKGDFMKAYVQNGYGSSEFLTLKEVAKPIPADNEMLVKVYATSLNAGDYFSLMGTPWMIKLTLGFPKPKNHILGWDVSGVVESVGKGITLFKPGDEIFTGCEHAFAEYVTITEKQTALKPSNLSFQEASAVPSAAVTALIGIRDIGKVQSGQSVLINGASGGVGTFAVQIAKALGGQVTGV